MANAITLRPVSHAHGHGDSQPLIGRDSSNTGFPWRGLPLLVVVLAVVLLARDPTVFLYPALRFEDGRDIFAYFYSHGDPQELLRFKVGYIPLLPNIIGYTLLGLPTRWIPYGFVAVPFLFSLFTYCLFFAPAYRYYIKSDLLRATVCILFPLPPFFHYDIHFGVDYIIWNALLLLTLLLMLPAPRGWMKIPWFLLVSLLIWSNPLTLAFVPVFLYRFFADQGSRWVYVLSLASVLAYQLMGVQHSQVFSSLGLLGSLQRAWNSAVLTLVLLVKQAYKAFWGPKIFIMSPGIAFLVFFLISVIVLIFYLRPPVRSRRVLALYSFYVSASIIFLSLFSRGEDHVVSIVINMRYVYVPSMLTYVLAFSICEAWLLAPEVGGRTAGFFGVNGLSVSEKNKRRLLCSTVVLFYFLLNLAMGYYRLGRDSSPPAGWYVSNFQNGVMIKEFFSKLADAEQSLCNDGKRFAGNAKEALQVKKGDEDWPFQVIPKCRHS